MRRKVWVVERRRNTDRWVAEEMHLTEERGRQATKECAACAWMSEFRLTAYVPATKARRGRG